MTNDRRVWPEADRQLWRSRSGEAAISLVSELPTGLDRGRGEKAFSVACRRIRLADRA